ncbi:hypothetical protein GCM10010840_14660 [Deinococcus aerolatus]|uniref:CRISPR-associated endoribonuclease Cas2 n=1 Tax=Deinococcus aerolatus TaxID=522487 RepID=A0ABQ2G7H8_9DEIO|nr:CRISPR-associated endonuclease Cas2 [Deinococcus aerolatus]GGL77852.1 hypothetical protein GCM10010840_14660 [Deinococcus aerolatus]
MTLRQDILVAFDTPSDGRRRRFTRLLSRYGVRVQRSVFRLSGSAREVQRLREALERVADHGEDLLLMTVVASGTWWQVGGVQVLEVPLVVSF